MEREEIRSAMEILAARVTLRRGEQGACRIAFEDLDLEAMIALGITSELAARLSSAPWWDEMVEDVVETPEFCDPDADSDEILSYARDVVREYIRKRL